MSACLDCGGTECFCWFRNRIRELENVLANVVNDVDYYQDQLGMQAPRISDTALTRARAALSAPMVAKIQGMVGENES